MPIGIGEIFKEIIREKIWMRYTNYKFNSEEIEDIWYIFFCLTDSTFSSVEVSYGKKGLYMLSGETMMSICRTLETIDFCCNRDAYSDAFTLIRKYRDDDGDSTGWNIYMFRADDKGIQNIINSSYAVKMELPECITDYDSFFEDLGFPKEAVRNGDVRIIKSNSRYITISYGDKSKEIEKSRLEKYKVMVQTKCVVLKIKALWNSSENNLYGIDKKKAIKCIPDIENYEYVPVNNSMLAKAEIPFLIFERNRGKCFIEMY